MRLLPVVNRELQVTARKARSYWARLLTAGIAVVFLGTTFWVVRLGVYWNSTERFQLLSWYSFVYCLFAGAMAAADSLSAERRENTLGLLFLTDLRSYDIVLGKLCATSLTTFFGALAILPVLAIPLMTGGVPYAEFWRVALSLINTLFLSLGVGLLVSACNQNAFRATGTALLVMLLLSFGLALLCEWMEHYWKLPALARGMALFSPWYTQAQAHTGWRWLGASRFWYSFLCVHGLALTLLAVSCAVVRRNWQEEAGHSSPFSLKAWIGAARDWNLGKGQTRRRFRLRLLEKNPFSWLAARERVSSPMLLVISAVWVCFGCWLASTGPGPASSRNPALQLIAWILVGLALHGLVMMKVSSSACQRFGADRQSGALELLVSTPLTVRSILRGQWQAIRRQVFGPGLIVFLVHGMVLYQALTLVFLANISTVNPGGLFLRTMGHLFSPLPPNPWEESFTLLLIIGAAVVLVAHWIALGWVGMWLALRLRQPRFAPWIALFLVLTPPWALFIMAIIGLLEFESTWTEVRWLFLCFRLAIGLHLLSDLVLSFWAWRRLHTQFRTAAADRFQTQPPRVPWPVRLKCGLRWASVGVGVMLLITGFHLEENWRGARAWRALELNLKAEGNPLSLESLTPPPIPPNQNFAEAPLVAEALTYGSNLARSGYSPPGPAPQLYQVSMWLSGTPRGFGSVDRHQSWFEQKSTDFQSWSQIYAANKWISTNGPGRNACIDVWQALSGFDAPLRELITATQRPFCRYLDATNICWPQHPFHLDLLTSLCDVLQHRASAKLTLGDSPEAFQEVQLAMYLAQSLAHDPHFHSELVRADLLIGILQPVWEGLGQGCWSDEQLLWFQTRFSEIDLIQEYPQALRLAIASQLHFWEQSRTNRARSGWLSRSTRLFAPMGWTYQRQMGLYRAYKAELSDAIDPQQRRVFPRRLQAARRRLENDTSFPRGSGNDLLVLIEAIGRTQAALEQATVACALECYRRDHGVYPEKLELLRPQYLNELPRDIVNGDPMRYHRSHPQEFVLYSVGWNQRDDGGVSRHEADWVWKYR